MSNRDEVQDILQRMRTDPEFALTVLREAHRAGIAEVRAEVRLAPPELTCSESNCP